jgi:GT2 family glycosyltransferase
VEKFFICLMKISVLIPTYNRKDWLLKTLVCISKQTYRDFEVIIVDASASEDQLGDSDLVAFKFTIHYIRYGVAGNVSKQRNIALQQAVGDILLFLDDDVEFDAPLFEDYVRLFKVNKYEAISGLVETPKFPRGSQPIQFKGNPFLDLHELNYQPCDFEVETYMICTANFAFTRSVYARLGDFDEKMFGILDDVDFGYRLMKFNIPCIHYPSVSVFHHQAVASGARSNVLGGWWFYYNVVYFHLKNRNVSSFHYFINCSWYLLRPSRSWLSPGTKIVRYMNFVKGFVKAWNSYNNKINAIC